MKKEIHLLLIITMSIEKKAMQRIEKEFKDMTSKDSLYIIGRDSNDLFKWNAMIQGPYSSPYAGGMFSININFLKNYPFSAPKDQYALTFLKTTGIPLSYCMTYLPRSRRGFALQRCANPLVSWFCLFCFGYLSHFFRIVLFMQSRFRHCHCYS
ncbi:unnamed protein product [Brassica oleracea var. botrytis]